MLQKWYFAANFNALGDGFDQIQGAVLSSRKVSSLRPYCLVDAPAFDQGFDQQLSWLKSQGVTLIRHTSEVFPLMKDVHGDSISVFSGHWLRCDIPVLEREDDFVLYTDIDVVFRSDPATLQERPRFLAATPEHQQDDTSYFNSGVMVMNLPALRDTRGAFLENVRSEAKARAGHDDQGAFNSVYRGQWDQMSNLWNWKPYWGPNEDAHLIHFVGPKPVHARKIIVGEGEEYGEPCLSMVRNSLPGYRWAIQELDKLTLTLYQPHLHED